MSTLVWDAPGTRTYETGIDRAVIYTPSGIAVPWNGLTSVQEKFDRETEATYIDGRKISDQVQLSEYAATIKAITYPDELMFLEGYGSVRDGVFIADQTHKTFDLTYRTLVGDDLVGNRGYKIHIIYNVTAIPKDVEHNTVGESAEFSDFEWDITAVPQELDYHRPTAHVIIDSTSINAEILSQLEDKLYGTESSAAYLLPLPELIASMGDIHRIVITDNGDGTFTASSEVEGLIVLGATYMDLVTIYEANTETIDADSYYLSDTLEGSELSDVDFVDNGDGTWTATTADTDLITITPDGAFVVQDTNAIFVNPYTWRVTST